MELRGDGVTEMGDLRSVVESWGHQRALAEGHRLVDNDLLRDKRTNGSTESAGDCELLARWRSYYLIIYITTLIFIVVDNPDFH